MVTASSPYIHIDRAGAVSRRHVSLCGAGGDSIPLLVTLISNLQTLVGMKNWLLI